MKPNTFFKKTTAINENKNEDQPGAPQSTESNPIDSEYKKLTTQMEPIIAQFEQILLTCGNRTYDDIAKKLKNLYGPSLKLYLDISSFRANYLNNHSETVLNSSLYNIKYSLSMIEAIDRLDDYSGYKSIVGKPMTLAERIIPPFIQLPNALKKATEYAKQTAAAPAPQERSRCIIL